MISESEAEYQLHRSRYERYERSRNKLYPGVNGFTPAMIQAIVLHARIDRAPTNEEISQAEVYEWIVSPPEKYFLYVNEKTGKATTWTGDELGTIGYGREYRSNFGDKRVPITVYGNNGKKYHGTYYKSAGSYARIKMVGSLVGSY